MIMPRPPKWRLSSKQTGILAAIAIMGGYESMGLNWTP